MPRQPDNEIQRIQALDRLAIMNTPPEAELNDLAWLAAYSCGMPYAQVNFVHTTRVWTKANIGFPETEVRRAVSPCAIVVSEGDTVAIPDTFEDGRVNLSPLVIQGPRIRSYAGAPIRTPQGETIGTLCVMDSRPHEFNETQLTALWSLARQVAVCLGLRRRTEVVVAPRKDDGDDAERRAQEYSRRVRRMVEQMPAALWSTDDNLRITMTLGGGLEAMHLRASEVVGRTLPEVLGTVDPAFPPVAAHADALAGEIPGPVRWSAYGRTMEVRVVPLRNDSGNIIGTLGVGLDVTERTRMDESMEETLRAMLEAASHPVSIDVGGTQPVLTSVPEAAPLRSA